MFSYAGAIFKSSVVIKTSVSYRKIYSTENGKTRASHYSNERVVKIYCDDHPTSAHLGIRKAFGKMLQLNYWPGLQRDVKQ